MIQFRKYGLSIGAFVLTAALSVSAVSAHTKTVTVKMTDTGFEPAVITASIDQPIHLHVVNMGKATHQFSIPHYHIFSQNLPPGTTDEVEFAPWEAGSYQIMSDPSGNYSPEFEAKFIVKQ